MSEPVFLNHEIVFNPTGNEFDKARDQLLGTYKLVKVEDWEYKFIKQPKLSIPKKIAEELEEYDAGEKGNYSLFSLSEEAREFYLTHNNIVTIYFASKALGVELVEVTDE